MRDIAFSRTSYRRFGLNTASKGEKILDSAGTHKRVVGQFCFINCCPRRMEGKFQNVSTIFTLYIFHSVLWGEKNPLREVIIR